MIYPLDSKFDNICKPVKEGKEFYCYSYIENSNNNFPLDFSLTTSNQYEEPDIYYSNTKDFSNSAKVINYFENTIHDTM